MNFKWISIIGGILGVITAMGSIYVFLEGRIATKSDILSLEIAVEASELSSERRDIELQVLFIDKQLREYEEQGIITLDDTELRNYEELRMQKEGLAARQIELLRGISQ